MSFVRLQRNPAVASPREQLYEQMTSNPAFRERNLQKSNAYLLESRPYQNLWSRITLYRSCTYVACQHFNFNSADWISDNLHVISSSYLRTMGKEYIFRFNRR